MSNYQNKVRERLVPFHYDRDSDRFQQGAWKNLSREEYRTNMRALERGGN